MPYTNHIPKEPMFNFFSNQTQSTESTEPLFETEKELILDVIEHATSSSKYYEKHALPEWKAQYPREQGYVHSYYVWENDYKLICELAETSDDEEILRAIYNTHRKGFLMMYIGRTMYPELYLNVHLPDDLIDYYINLPMLMEDLDLSEESNRLNLMLKVGFNSIVNEKIQRSIDKIVVEKRKRKEDKTKNKLKAFLITASATKSVLTGNSIDDVVEASITSDVDNEVLDYMTQLFGDKK